VLLLNKSTRKSDITVNWEQLGMKGKQYVRDLWEQKDLGAFNDSFTAKNLSQHEHILIKIGTVGSKPLPGPVPVPEEKYTVTKNGTTYLSDIYYIMKEFDPPVMDKNFFGKTLKINGVSYEKGIGCKSRSAIMYKLNGKADRFKAKVGLDDASDENETGRFRVLVEGKFGGRPIFNSDKMKKGDDEIEVDIDVSGLDFILLEFTGKNVFGNWADARVVTNE